MKKVITIVFLFTIGYAQPKREHNLIFDSLAARWDEAMPLGNGMLGALVWKKNEKLRVSLDRADLWDERQVLDLTKFNYKWVKQQVVKNQYDTVHVLGDDPYENSPYPTKIPAGALEFDISKFGKVISNTLDISNALNTIKFTGGVVCYIYIHASKNTGYFGFENLPSLVLVPQLIIPDYNNGQKGIFGNSTEGQGLQKLGYDKGNVIIDSDMIIYHQPTWGGHYYEIKIQWKKVSSNHIIGAWTITNNEPVRAKTVFEHGDELTGWQEHEQWWKNFWSKSAVTIPEKKIEKQYYLELYKLGCVARKGAPAITLQAIWTADNGSLPPWKGDFHNDLNTQLSYWPCYTSNHLQEAATFTDWLWDIREENKKFTNQYFGIDGLDVPGVVTIHGYAMGGWIQYSLSPTTAAWLAQHFFWQWKYSMDKNFLLDQAYPYVHDVAVYLEQITRGENGKRKLPLSSSPEYNDNTIGAWFTDWTNYDLSLTKYLFKIAAEISDSAGRKEEARKWNAVLKELPYYSVNETGLAVSASQNLDVSHRHMSPYMAIYPLELLSVRNKTEKDIVDKSIKHLQAKGTRSWCGYSFSWMACLYARAAKGDSAEKMLQIFASNFCSPNSFHLNGDQKGGQYSDFTYRPFTLEGNFAFAQGVHEMLLQNHDGYLELLPAVPQSWKDICFSNLRAEGAFLISLQKKNGIVSEVKIVAEKNEVLKLKLPFKTFYFTDKSLKYSVTDNILSLSLRSAQEIVIKNGYQQ